MQTYCDYKARNQHLDSEKVIDGVVEAGLSSGF